MRNITKLFSNPTCYVVGTLVAANFLEYELRIKNLYLLNASNIISRQSLIIKLIILITHSKLKLTHSLVDSRGKDVIRAGRKTF